MIFYDGMYWSWGPYDLPPDGDFDISDILGSAQSALQMMNYGDIKTFDSGINSSVCGNKGSSIVVAMYTWNGGGCRRVRAEDEIDRLALARGREHGWRSRDPVPIVGCHGSDARALDRRACPSRALLPGRAGAH